VKQCAQTAYNKHRWDAIASPAHLLAQKGPRCSHMKQCTITVFRSVVNCCWMKVSTSLRHSSSWKCSTLKCTQPAMWPPCATKSESRTSTTSIWLRSGLHKTPFVRVSERGAHSVVGHTT
jgi:hypothetical protein